VLCLFTQTSCLSRVLSRFGRQFPGKSAVGSVGAPLQATLFDVVVGTGRIAFDVEVKFPTSFPSDQQMAFIGWIPADEVGACGFDSSCPVCFLEWFVLLGFPT
jgi:hypothetical protein